jgi:hypothetical protein
MKTPVGIACGPPRVKVTITKNRKMDSRTITRVRNEIVIKLDVYQAYMKILVGIAIN